MVEWANSSEQIHEGRSERAEREGAEARGPTMADRNGSQHEGPSGRSRAEGAELKGGRAEGGRLKRASPRGPIRLGQCERGRSMGLIREGADPCG